MNRLVIAAQRGGRASGSASASLADGGDTVQEALRRLRMISLFMSCMPLVTLALTKLFAPPGTPQHDAFPTLVVVLSIAMATSIAVHLTLRSERIAPGRRLDVGFAYQAVIALVVGVFRHVTPWAPGDGFREVSPVVVVVLVFAALIPNKPRRTLYASLVSAAMDPVGLGISIARGNPVPPTLQLLAICGTPLIACAVATLISHVVHGLARTADEARSMGSYDLTEKLGSGGMGEVWRAKHRLLARPAAIKLIRADAGGEAGALRRFEREAQATAALKEPHTIQLYDFGVTDDGTFYYVMELLEGFDLEELVTKHGPQPAERVVAILTQVCASLEEAHEHGLIHRDIKPANIYLCRYGRHVDFVKVLDFGLVKPREASIAAELAPTITVEGALSGTPAYIAPEVALGETDIDGRADLYALGCVAYWLLTGTLVFDGETAIDRRPRERGARGPVGPRRARGARGARPVDPRLSREGPGEAAEVRRRDRGAPRDHRDAAPVVARSSARLVGHPRPHRCDGLDARAPGQRRRSPADRSCVIDGSGSSGQRAPVVPLHRPGGGRSLYASASARASPAPGADESFNLAALRSHYPGDEPTRRAARELRSCASSWCPLAVLPVGERRSGGPVRTVLGPSKHAPPIPPTVIVAGCTPPFGARCRAAARKLRLRVCECSPTAIWTVAQRQRAVAIVMTHTQYAIDPIGFDLIARGLGAAVVRVESECIDDADLEVTLDSLVG